MALLLYCLTIGLLESHRFKVTMYTVIFGSVRLFMANAVILRHSHDCWWILWNFIIENVACIYYFHSAFPFKPLAGRLHGLLTCTIVIRWSDVSIVVCVVYFSGVTKGGRGGSCPPSRKPELHCILLLHNFTLHRTRTCNWNWTTHTIPLQLQYWLQGW